MIGRFIQEDSYLGDGLNLFAYCQNNPLVYFDPDGQATRWCENKSKAINHLMENEGMTREEAIKKYDDLRAEGYSAAEARYAITGKLDSDRPEIQRQKYKEYTGLDPTGEIHHGLPEEFSDRFKAVGIDVNSGEFYYDLPKDKHRLKSGQGLHTKNCALGKTWNASWKDFFDEHPYATKKEILRELQRMENVTGIGQYKAIKK